MSDTRQVLEEAFKVIHPAPCDPRYPDDDEDFAWCKIFDRFRRFLDAEAWTDTAMMLVPEGYSPMIQPGLNAMWHAALVEVSRTMTRVTNYRAVAETPALALAQACLKARENGDG